MTDFQKLNELAAADYGVLTTAAATRAGISRTAVANFVNGPYFEEKSE